jgi:hypothetical protein
LLGPPRALDEFERPELFGGERVSDLDHGFIGSRLTCPETFGSGPAVSLDVQGVGSWTRGPALYETAPSPVCRARHSQLVHIMRAAIETRTRKGRSPEPAPRMPGQLETARPLRRAGATPTHSTSRSMQIDT